MNRIASDRGFCAGALALPVAALLAFLAIAGAPGGYLLIDAVALGIALVWIALGRMPLSERAARLILAALVLLLFVPLLTGPQLNGIARWLPLGPVQLHAGMLAFPAIAVLAAREPRWAPAILLAALAAALLQPDGGTAFAITFAAVGLYHVTGDWRLAMVCIVAFFGALVATIHGELAPQEFVERVFQTAFAIQPIIALTLALALAASFALMLFAIPHDRPARFALAGTLFGFFIIALMNTYPFPLIGHGAASILGFGLALGLVRKDNP